MLKRWASWFFVVVVILLPARTQNRQLTGREQTLADFGIAHCPFKWKKMWESARQLTSLTTLAIGLGEDTVVSGPLGGCGKNMVIRVLSLRGFRIKVRWTRLHTHSHRAVWESLAALPFNTAGERGAPETHTLTLTFPGRRVVGCLCRRQHSAVGTLLARPVLINPQWLMEARWKRERGEKRRGYQGSQTGRELTDMRFKHR